MRYRCSKSCGYLYQGKLEGLPEKCPGCGASLVKYILARDKGTRFEEKVRKLIQLYLGGKPQRDRFSGSRSGKKGDLWNLPYPVNNFLVECKNDKSLSIRQWWKQAVDEGTKMAKYPWLVIQVGDIILSIKELKTDLSLIRKSLKCGGKS